MTRRNFLTTSAGTLLSMGLSPDQLRALENGQGEGNWSFIAVNDLHYHDEACGPWFEKVVAAMKASAPNAEFCLLGGDQADDAKPEQMGPVRDIFKTLGLPLYATIGNHDWTADDSRRTYDDIFPGQGNQVFEHRGWQIVGLDSSDGPRYKEISIQPATLQWLDETLPKLSRTKPTVVWTHFPLGEGVTYRPKNTDDLLERLANLNLQATLSGHWHGLTEHTWRDALLTTDRCCSRFRDNHDHTTEKGWFVCHAEQGKIRREFVEIPKELRTSV